MNFQPERAQTCICWELPIFLRYLGAFVGSWGKIIGFLRCDDNSLSARKMLTRALVATGAMSLVLSLAVVFYLRQISVAGSPQTYLYLEVGGTLLSFCYAANALVRFRGTHDRTALILAFGFVLSGRTRCARRSCRELTFSSLGFAPRRAVLDCRGLLSPAQE